MKFSKSLLSIICISILPFLAIGQGILTFDNPSFEGTPAHSTTPNEWENCGFPNESPPDIQPSFTFLVSTTPYEGKTYLGMVVRDNDSWESVGTRLSAPMVKDQPYEFQISLARSLSYMSQSRKSDQPANYITPVKLRIWGGLDICSRDVLLAESPLVKHSEWGRYTFNFQSSLEDIQFIVLEVYYESSKVEPYNGNLLLDAASAIMPIDSIESLPFATVNISGIPNNNTPPGKYQQAGSSQDEQHSYPPNNDMGTYKARSQSPEAIDSNKVSELLDAVNLDHYGGALHDLANYISKFNTPRWQWKLVIDHDNKKTARQSMRSLNNKIESLNLKQFLFVVKYDDLPKDAYKISSRPYKDGSIDVYY